MARGKRKWQQQDTFWVAADKLGSGPRNAFYDRLNLLLDEIEFDGKLEKAVEPFYAKTGRKGLPPGVYFRMIFIGYFEDISSQRGIAWRCDDSRSLARFLGYAPGESTPDHSTLSLTRERLPMEIHQLAFELILTAASDQGLLKGKTIGVDATDLEANASLKSIVRKDNGDDWREYLRKLYEEETGNSDPDDEELRRFDKSRKPKKKVSNDDWESETDPDSRIGKMKDGRFHLKYKAENAVDLETEIIVAAEVYHGDVGDTKTIEDTVNTAKTNLREAKTGCEVKEVVADSHCGVGRRSLRSEKLADQIRARVESAKGSGFADATKLKWHLDLDYAPRCALLFLATLVALYLGSWELTKRAALGQIVPETRKTDLPPHPRAFDSSPAPFVVSRERYYGLPPKYGDYREYHFWFFGYTAKLPFERVIP